MRNEVARRALDRALDEHDHLLLLYQPIHDAHDRSIYAAEALLRQRRESGEIREAGIITAAAETASLDDLGRLTSWLTTRAWEDASRWKTSSGRDVRLNVNLSPREFEEPGLIDRLNDAARQCGITPGSINLEITETTYIDDPLQTVELLREIHNIGFQLWLDDFGTGHSTLTHLQRFPVQGIKLAESFVRDLVHDRRSRELVRLLIDFAHDFEMKVIAEAVEHEEQLSILRDLECDYIQGFLFSRPMEATEFERKIADGQ
jgi:EAL domain-containing protein (putative c-di-GMP-specific phosphodiesterase class I)